MVSFDIKEAFSFLDKPLSFGGPLYYSKDENGVVILRDKKGVARILMTEADFAELIKYKEEHGSRNK